MGEPSNRVKVAVALIGVGPTWELHYREAVRRLSSRICVRAVCDSVHVRAAAVADEFEAIPLSSPWQLAQRNDVHAWIILDPGWFDTYPTALAIERNLPVLLANPFCSTIAKLHSLFQRSLESGDMLMPEILERFQPTTIRLRELIATRLGRVHRIEMGIPLDDPLESDPAPTAADVIVAMDWCLSLVGQPVVSSSVHRSAELITIDLSLGNGEKVVIKAWPTTDVVPNRTVFCDSGKALITSPTQMTWNAGQEGSEESLENDRSPEDIILDQFCRRALGGLVPAPTLKEALQAVGLAEHILGNHFDRS
jgi:predicted dehydrogenase